MAFTFCANFKRGLNIPKIYPQLFFLQSYSSMEIIYHHFRKEKIMIFSLLWKGVQGKKMYTLLAICGFTLLIRENSYETAIQYTRIYMYNYYYLIFFKSVRLVLLILGPSTVARAGQVAEQLSTAARGLALCLQKAVGGRGGSRRYFGFLSERNAKTLPRKCFCVFSE